MNGLNLMRKRQVPCATHRVRLATQKVFCTITAQPFCTPTQLLYPMFLVSLQATASCLLCQCFTSTPGAQYTRARCAEVKLFYLDQKWAMGKLFNG